MWCRPRSPDLCNVALRHGRSAAAASGGAAVFRVGREVVERAARTVKPARDAASSALTPLFDRSLQIRRPKCLYNPVCYCETVYHSCGSATEIGRASGLDGATALSRSARSKLDRGDASFPDDLGIPAVKSALQIRGFAPRLRIVLIALVAIALAMQGYLVGAHSHRGTNPLPSVSNGQHVSNTGSRHDRVPADTPDSCPICQGIALTAALLPVTSVALPAPVSVSAWYIVSRSWQLLPRQRSHLWNSRGPPATSLVQR